MTKSMRLRQHWRQFRGDQSGGIAPIVAIILIVLLGVAALAVDVGQLVAAKGELQRAVDAGAMAGARALWPLTLPQRLPETLNPDCGAAYSKALETTTHASNLVVKEKLTAAQVTVEVGRWDYLARTFAAGWSANANAVKVVGTKPSIELLFARIFGLSSSEVRAQSIAVMDWASAIGKGGLPIAINERFATPDNTIFINFNPDPLDNGGWFAEPPDPSSASTFRDYIENGTCPPLHIGDIINLDNGVDTSALQALNDKLLEHQAQGVPYDTYLPVVKTEKFNHMEPIDNFVSFRIEEVVLTGDEKGVRGKVLGLATCSYAEPGGSTINGLTGLLSPPKAVK